ncbi:DUF397 domain-containing protein [Actinokineospora enzanensis]|uniref:DUF397 domain-containing protein n=1 Tax=Actinokineospora enzanensis TaxID=155975 RepID=UPI000360E5C5|nr:DUF397 domain-containing protein [Actinokineospora enzanensis]
MEAEKWRKAQRSGANNSCIEVRSDRDAVRDSKNPAGPILRADVSALLTAVQAGRIIR